MGGGISDPLSAHSRRLLPIGQCTWGHGDKFLAPGKIFLSPSNNIGEIFSFYTVLVLEKYGESGISISSAFLPWGRLKDGSFATIFMDGQRETREGASPSNQGEANPVSLRSSASSKGRGENMRGTYIKKTARSAAPSPLNPLNLQNLLNPLSPPALHEKNISHSCVSVV